MVGFWRGRAMERDDMSARQQRCQCGNQFHPERAGPFMRDEGVKCANLHPQGSCYSRDSAADTSQANQPQRSSSHLKARCQARKLRKRTSRAQDTLTNRDLLAQVEK